MLRRSQELKQGANIYQGTEYIQKYIHCGVKESSGQNLFVSHQKSQGQSGTAGEEKPTFQHQVMDSLDQPAGTSSFLMGKLAAVTPQREKRNTGFGFH
ncbi:hypothetical protein ACOMHN_009015 [Nucella lapillus]